ncbi:MAG: sodium-translocating pyrophosphatase, partial [Candidatus Heimdallarchaeota archaeon]
MAAETNARTTQAASESRSKALETAYKGGLVMGLLVVALSILGISLLFALYSIGKEDPEPFSIIAFGMGASFAALFAQLGGGIFTKSADVGADLVGKLEAGIPEDDARNPGVIADNVGDAVGDCAGRGADLFESISGETIGGMIVGLLFFTILIETDGVKATTAMAFILFPLIARGLSMLGTILTAGIVKLKDENESNAMKPLTNAFYLTSLFSFLVFAVLIIILFDGILELILASAIGIILAVVTLVATDYYTGDNKPVLEIVDSSETGAATNIITGLSVGMRSTWVPVLGIVVAVVASYWLGYNFGASDQKFAVAMRNSDNDIVEAIGVRHLWGIYASTIATMAMLSVTPIILAMDGYGPIADQSGGIAQMGEAGDDVREIIDSLDMVGNTTKALAKGYGMTSAGLAALLLFQAYLQDYIHLVDGVTDLPEINLANPTIMGGLFIGALLPFVFSAMSMGAVGRAANGMIHEIRRQFRENGDAIMAREMDPDYAACVDVSTQAALKEMIAPSILVIITPILVGFILGPLSLAAFLIGATISGILLGMTLNNAGGAWDNAKKTIEARPKGDEHGKGTATHEAAIIGDTVGDPSKDTSGPSIHVLIKLVNTIAITLLPLFIAFNGNLEGKF